MVGLAAADDASVGCTVSVMALGLSVPERLGAVVPLGTAVVVTLVDGLSVLSTRLGMAVVESFVDGPSVLTTKLGMAVDVGARVKLGSVVRVGISRAGGVENEGDSEGVAAAGADDKVGSCVANGLSVRVGPRVAEPSPLGGTVGGATGAAEREGTIESMTVSIEDGNGVVLPIEGTAVVPRGLGAALGTIVKLDGTRGVVGEEGAGESGTEVAFSALGAIDGVRVGAGKSVTRSGACVGVAKGLSVGRWMGTLIQGTVEDNSV